MFLQLKLVFLFLVCFLWWPQGDGSRSKLAPPQSPRPGSQQRELFEGWCEYVEENSGRPFYYNRETRSKSWKPPRRRGPSPRLKVQKKTTGTRSVPIRSRTMQIEEQMQQRNTEKQSNSKRRASYCCWNALDRHPIPNGSTRRKWKPKS